MYLMFKYKDMLPSEYVQLPYGEKQIVSVFLKREIEERSKEISAMFGGK